MREEIRRSDQTIKRLCGRDKSPKESTYKRKLMAKLRQIPSSLWYSHQAGSIRGIADVIGIINGRFIALEIKRSKAEYSKQSPRKALQEKFLDNVNRAGGYGSFIYPENEEEVLLQLKQFHN